MDGREPCKYIKNVRVAFVALCHYITICIIESDANKPEKGQVLETYIYCMDKLSTKHLFIRILW